MIVNTNKDDDITNSNKDDDIKLEVSDNRVSYQFVSIDTGEFNSSYSNKRESDEHTQQTEYNDGERYTVDAGYRDLKTQIQTMLLAGEQVNSNRMFDNVQSLENEEFAERVARIRHPNTDLVDITTYTDELNEKLATAKSVAQRHQYEQSLQRQDGNPNKRYEKPETSAPADPETSQKDV